MTADRSKGGEKKYEILMQTQCLRESSTAQMNDTILYIYIYIYIFIHIYIYILSVYIYIYIYIYILSISIYIYDS